ncbi:hypothetical protein DFJ58DRAFT_736332 [Suillus subalutaceus]|uniref:uncharacterized protein n=1 Tax=Suillus subalutaceus TaxID=48586 RepID=UPI001B886580|nr:uncharacterized protein DFJ58DRAFT_736332 [Suillus subalutaceus]KAG1832576.1 hypothetical protein DFJ58DRAFT_736332 [Suillus subalutaceus]
MLASALDAGTIADEAANELDEIFGEDSKEDEEEAAEEKENVRENEELGDMDDIGLGLNGLYQFDQVMDDQGSMADLSPAPTAAQTTAAVVPDNNIDSLPFDQFDISSLDMIHLNSFLASLPQVPYDPFTAIGPTYGLVDQDLDFSFMHDSSNSFNYQYSPPVIHEPTGHLLPAFPGDTTMPCNLLLSHSNHLPPTQYSPPVIHEPTGHLLPAFPGDTTMPCNLLLSHSNHLPPTQYSPPVIHEPTGHLLPAFPGDTTMPCNLPLSHSNHLPPTQYSPPVIHEPTGHLLPAFPGDTTMPCNLPLSHSNHLPPTQYSPPVIHEPTGHLLPAFPGDTTMPSNLLLSHSNHLPPTTPLTSTSSINMTDSNTFDRLASLEEEGPR